MSFSCAGPEDGFPVVYCRGAAGSPRWRTPDLEAVIERLRTRYMVVDRPGYGGSDPAPARSVADFAADVGELMTMLGYGRFSVVGVSAGAPYALACGWALADRIVALAAVSPLGPASGSGSSVTLRYRLALPPFAPPCVGPALARGCVRVLGLKRRTPVRAVIEDYLVCRRPWGFEPADLHIPVTLWHGRADRLVPLSHTLALGAAIPVSTARVDPEGGHFFYSRRLGEIIESLLPDELGDTSQRIALAA